MILWKINESRANQGKWSLETGMDNSNMACYARLTHLCPGEDFYNFLYMNPSDDQMKKYHTWTLPSIFKIGQLVMDNSYMACYTRLTHLCPGEDFYNFLYMNPSDDQMKKYHTWTLPSIFKIGQLLIFREKMYKNVLVGINGLSWFLGQCWNDIVYCYVVNCPKLES